MIMGLLLSFMPSRSQTQEIDLSGTWGFQTDVMDFRRGSLSPRYKHTLQETIVLPGITDNYQIGYKVPYRYIDRLTRKYEKMAPWWILGVILSTVMGWGSSRSSQSRRFSRV